MKNYLHLTRHQGNNTLFETLEMGILSILWNVPLHIHAEGLRGTGKTTVMRAARQIMPPIMRIKDCLYNCDPQAPHCPHHRHLSGEEITRLGTETVARPFLEISHSAKIGTVAGSIDLQKITDASHPEAALLPGIIPQAHRGVIFIDEINRLADTSPEITDILLDVMGTKPGQVQIEETGLPVVKIPLQVSVWAASNPDEEPGPLQDIRRQLSDRFDLLVEMERPSSVDDIARILMQSGRKHFNESNRGASTDDRELAKVKEAMVRQADKYAHLEMPDFLRNYIARLYTKYDLESFRAIEAIQHAALLHCALRQRDQVLVSDILKVIPLALKHRTDTKTVSRIMNSSITQAEQKIEPLYAPSAFSENEQAVAQEYAENQETDVIYEEKKAHHINSKTLLSPLKELFKGRNTPQDSHEDEIKASPLNKAKRLQDLNLDEMVKAEKDLK